MDELSLNPGDPAVQTWTTSACLAGAASVLAYAASRVVSPLICKSYNMLSEKDKRNWDSRVPSNLHAVVSTALTVYIFFFSGLFSENGDAKQDAVPVPARASIATNAALGISIGYFAFDILLILRNFPHLGGIEMVVHHLLSALAVLCALLAQYAQVYILAMLSAEITTPCINTRWALDKCGMRAHPAYLANGLVLLALWTTNRVIMFVPFFWHQWTHRQELMTRAWFDLFLLVPVPLILMALNLMWYDKIVRGAYKALRRASKSASELETDSHLQ